MTCLSCNKYLNIPTKAAETALLNIIVFCYHWFEDDQNGITNIYGLIENDGEALQHIQNAIDEENKVLKEKLKKYERDNSAELQPLIQYVQGVEELLRSFKRMSDDMDERIDFALRNSEKVLSPFIEK